MSRFHDEFFKQKGPKHDELVMKCISKDGINKILDPLKPLTYCEYFIKNHKEYGGAKILNIDEDYETEVICKNGNFIIGYADIVYTILLQTDINHYSLPHRYQCVIEAKPEMNDVGAVVRQLKTYADILDIYGNEYEKSKVGENDRPYRVRGKIISGNLIIATYDNVSPEVLEYLLHEGIRVVKF
jgi:hypothetical protein